MLQEMESPAESPRAIPGSAIDRALLLRIVESPAFARSPRLSSFLIYICNEIEAGREDQISEQSIGTAVFGRDPDYDSTIDSIVRSHATRLRHRLREYFERDGEGANEVNILTVPKGSYIPRFEPRPYPTAAIPPEPAGESVPWPLALEPRLIADALKEDGASQAIRTIRALQVALVVIAMVAISAVALLLIHLNGSSHRINHTFWSGFFKTSPGRTIIVESDSGLVLMQHLSHRPIDLHSYASGEYLKSASGQPDSDALAFRLASKRYTPVVDTYLYDRVAKLLRGTNANADFRFARDLRLDELKEGNAILMGSHESNPWVGLFEPSMNFLFKSDLNDGLASIVNRHPDIGEQPLYAMTENDPEHTVYGLLAYRPNLTRSGHVLIVEGLTVAGTQSACDFLLDDSYLLPFLEKIRRPNGNIPHFEVLVRSNSLAGQSSKLDPIAYRVENDR
jgi:hypothetical protein